MGKMFKMLERYITQGSYLLWEVREDFPEGVKYDLKKKG